MSRRPREIRPETRDEVVQCVRDLVAKEHTYAVEGFGTRRSFAAPEGWIRARISLAALDRIERLDAEDMTCRVQCGVRLSDLMAALEEKGLTLESGPFADPRSRSLGGLFSQAPHSPRGWDRGSLRSQLLGISALDGSGREFAAGGRVVKNVAGYDLMKLFVGGGGAWFTGLELELRLIRRPALTRVFSSAPQPIEEALGLWRSLRPSWTEARSLDLHVLGDGSATVELVVAGRHRRVEAYRAPEGLTLDESAPELWDRLSPIADIAYPTHRGQVLPSQSRTWVQALGQGCRGSLHLHGHYSVLVEPTRTQQHGLFLPGFSHLGMMLAGAEQAARLKRTIARLLAPDRLSFDTPVHEEVDRI